MRNIIQNPVTGVSKDGTYRIVRDYETIMTVKAEDWMDARRVAASVLSGYDYTVKYRDLNGKYQSRFICGDISDYRDRAAILEMRSASSGLESGTLEDAISEVCAKNPLARRMSPAVWNKLRELEPGLFKHICAALIDKGKQIAVYEQERQKLLRRLSALVSEVKMVEDGIKSVEEKMLAA
jgi:hypothetical protein